jgi:hypothetical protein
VEVLILQVFVSFVLIAGSLLMFVYSMRQRDHEHSDRLAILPIETDTVRRVDPASSPHQRKSN